MSKTVIISGGLLDEGFAEKVLEANPESKDIHRNVF